MQFTIDDNFLDKITNIQAHVTANHINNNVVDFTTIYDNVKNIFELINKFGNFWLVKMLTQYSENVGQNVVSYVLKFQEISLAQISLHHTMTGDSEFPNRLLSDDHAREETATEYEKFERKVTAYIIERVKQNNYEVYSIAFQIVNFRAYSGYVVDASTSTNCNTRCTYDAIINSRDQLIYFLKLDDFKTFLTIVTLMNRRYSQANKHVKTELKNDGQPIRMDEAVFIAVRNYYNPLTINSDTNRTVDTKKIIDLSDRAACESISMALRENTLVDGDEFINQIKRCIQIISLNSECIMQVKTHLLNINLDDKAIPPIADLLTGNDKDENFHIIWIAMLFRRVVNMIIDKTRIDVNSLTTFIDDYKTTNTVTSNIFDDVQNSTIKFANMTMDQDDHISRVAIDDEFTQQVKTIVDAHFDNIYKRITAVFDNVGPNALIFYQCVAEYLMLMKIQANDINGYNQILGIIADENLRTTITNKDMVIPIKHDIDFSNIEMPEGKKINEYTDQDIMTWALEYQDQHVKLFDPNDVMDSLMLERASPDQIPIMCAIIVLKMAMDEFISDVANVVHLSATTTVRDILDGHDMPNEYNDVIVIARNIGNAIFNDPVLKINHFAKVLVHTHIATDVEDLITKIHEQAVQYEQMFLSSWSSMFTNKKSQCEKIWNMLREKLRLATNDALVENIEESQRVHEIDEFLVHLDSASTTIDTKSLQVFFKRAGVVMLTANTPLQSLHDIFTRVRSEPVPMMTVLKRKLQRQKEHHMFRNLMFLTCALTGAGAYAHSVYTQNRELMKNLENENATARELSRTSEAVRNMNASLSGIYSRDTNESVLDKTVQRSVDTYVGENMDRLIATNNKLLRMESIFTTMEARVMSIVQNRAVADKIAFSFRYGQELPKTISIDDDMKDQLSGMFESQFDIRVNWDNPSKTRDEIKVIGDTVYPSSIAMNEFDSDQTFNSLRNMQTQYEQQLWDTVIKDRKEHELLSAASSLNNMSTSDQLLTATELKYLQKFHTTVIVNGEKVKNYEEIYTSFTDSAPSKEVAGMLKFIKSKHESVKVGKSEAFVNTARRTLDSLFTTKELTDGKQRQKVYESLNTTVSADTTRSALMSKLWRYNLTSSDPMSLDSDLLCEVDDDNKKCVTKFTNDVIKTMDTMGRIYKTMSDENDRRNAAITFLRTGLLPLGQDDDSHKRFMTEFMSVDCTGKDMPKICPVDSLGKVNDLNDLDPDTLGPIQYTKMNRLIEMNKKMADVYMTALQMAESVTNGEPVRTKELFKGILVGEYHHLLSSEEYKTIRDMNYILGDIDTKVKELRVYRASMLDRIERGFDPLTRMRAPFDAWFNAHEDRRGFRDGEVPHVPNAFVPLEYGNQGAMLDRFKIVYYGDEESINSLEYALNESQYQKFMTTVNIINNDDALKSKHSDVDVKRQAMAWVLFGRIPTAQTISAQIPEKDLVNKQFVQKYHCSLQNSDTCETEFIDWDAIESDQRMANLRAEMVSNLSDDVNTTAKQVMNNVPLIENAMTGDGITPFPTAKNAQRKYFRMLRQNIFLNENELKRFFAFTDKERIKIMKEQSRSIAFDVLAKNPILTDSDNEGQLTDLMEKFKLNKDLLKINDKTRLKYAHELLTTGTVTDQMDKEMLRQLFSITFDTNDGALLNIAEIIHESALQVKFTVESKDKSMLSLHMQHHLKRNKIKENVSKMAQSKDLHALRRSRMLLDMYEMDEHVKQIDEAIKKQEQTRRETQAGHEKSYDTYKQDYRTLHQDKRAELRAKLESQLRDEFDRRTQKPKVPKLENRLLRDTYQAGKFVQEMGRDAIIGRIRDLDQSDAVDLAESIAENKKFSLKSNEASDEALKIIALDIDVNKVDKDMIEKYSRDLRDLRAGLSKTLGTNGQISVDDVISGKYNADADLDITDGQKSELVNQYRISLNNYSRLLRRFESSDELNDTDKVMKNILYLNGITSSYATVLEMTGVNLESSLRSRVPVVSYPSKFAYLGQDTKYEFAGNQLTAKAQEMVNQWVEKFRNNFDVRVNDVRNFVTGRLTDIDVSTTEQRELLEAMKLERSNLFRELRKEWMERTTAQKTTLEYLYDRGMFIYDVNAEMTIDEQIGLNRSYHVSNAPIANNSAKSLLLYMENNPSVELQVDVGTRAALQAMSEINVELKEHPYTAAVKFSKFGKMPEVADSENMSLAEIRDYYKIITTQFNNVCTNESSVMCPVHENLTSANDETTKLMDKTVEVLDTLRNIAKTSEKIETMMLTPSMIQNIIMGDTGAIDSFFNRVQTIAKDTFHQSFINKMKNDVTDLKNMRSEIKDFNSVHRVFTMAPEEYVKYEKVLKQQLFSFGGVDLTDRLDDIIEELRIARNRQRRDEVRSKWQRDDDKVADALYHWDALDPMVPLQHIAGHRYGLERAVEFGDIASSTVMRLMMPVAGINQLADPEKKGKVITRLLLGETDAGVTTERAKYLWKQVNMRESAGWELPVDQKPKMLQSYDLIPQILELEGFVAKHTEATDVKEVVADLLWDMDLTDAEFSDRIKIKSDGDANATMHMLRERINEFHTARQRYPDSKSLSQANAGELVFETMVSELGLAPRPRHSGVFEYFTALNDPKQWKQYVLDAGMEVRHDLAVDTNTMRIFNKRRVEKSAKDDPTQCSIKDSRCFEDSGNVDFNELYAKERGHSTGLSELTKIVLGTVAIVAAAYLAYRFYKRIQKLRNAKVEVGPYDFRTNDDDTQRKVKKYYTDTIKSTSTNDHAQIIEFVVFKPDDNQTVNFCKNVVFVRCEITPDVLASALGAADTVALIESIVTADDLKNTPSPVKNKTLHIGSTVVLKKYAVFANVIDNVDEIYLYVENRVSFDVYVHDSLKQIATRQGTTIVPMDSSDSIKNKFFESSIEVCNCPFHNVSRDVQHTFASYMCRRKIDVWRFENEFIKLDVNMKNKLTDIQEFKQQIVNVLNTGTRCVFDANTSVINQMYNNMYKEIRTINSIETDANESCQLLTQHSHAIGIYNIEQREIVNKLCGLILFKTFGNQFTNMIKTKQNRTIRILMRACESALLQSVDFDSTFKAKKSLKMSNEQIHMVMDRLCSDHGPLYWRFLAALFPQLMRDIDGDYLIVAKDQDTKRTLVDDWHFKSYEDREDVILFADPKSLQNKNPDCIGVINVDLAQKDVIRNESWEYCCCVRFFNNGKTFQHELISEICKNYFTHQTNVRMRNVVFDTNLIPDAVAENYFVNSVTIRSSAKEIVTGKNGKLNTLHLYIIGSNAESDETMDLTMSIINADREFTDSTGLILKNKRSGVEISAGSRGDEGNFFFIDSILTGLKSLVKNIDILEWSTVRKISVNKTLVSVNNVMRNKGTPAQPNDRNTALVYTIPDMATKTIQTAQMMFNQCDQLRLLFDDWDKYLVTRVTANSMDDVEKIRLKLFALATVPTFALQTNVDMINGEPVDDADFIIVPKNLTAETVLNAVFFKYMRNL
jgi:hypothetical protein